VALNTFLLFLFSGGYDRSYVDYKFGNGRDLSYYFPFEKYSLIIRKLIKFSAPFSIWDFPFTD